MQGAFTPPAVGLCHHPFRGRGICPPPPSPLLPLPQRGEAKPCTTGGLRVGWASEVLLSHGKERGLGVTPRRKAAGPG